MSNSDTSHMKTDNTGPNALSFGWYRIIEKSGTQITVWNSVFRNSVFSHGAAALMLLASPMVNTQLSRKVERSEKLALIEKTTPVSIQPLSGSVKKK